MPAIIPTPPDRDPPGLEQTLREFVRESPYLGVSLLLHAVVLLVFMAQTNPIEFDEDISTLVVSPQAPPDVVPPTPIEPEPLEQPPEPVETPNITEDKFTDDPTDDIADADDSIEHAFDDSPSETVLGVGAGSREFGSGNGLPGKYSGRGSGTTHSPRIEAGLAWLAAHQHPDGYWSGESFSDECGKLGDTECTGRGSVHHDVGVTSLALLAFLGAGQTDRRGTYKQTVKAGLRFLSRSQDGGTGNFAPDSLVGSSVYDHMLATLTLVEAYALTDSSIFKRPAERGLRHIADVRNTGRAWRYRLDGPPDADMVLNPDDASVTGWALLALVLGRDAGLEIDEAAIEDGLRFLDELTDENGRTGYVSRGGGSSRPIGRDTSHPAEQTEAMTAVAMLCRIFADPEMQRGDLDNAGDIQRGADLLLATPITWDEENRPGRVDFYYWYYATYALYQVGGSSWTSWQRGISDIAAAQRDDDDATGSWDPQADAWGGEGGRVYSTALLTLVLEAQTRYGSIMGR